MFVLSAKRQKDLTVYADDQQMNPFASEPLVLDKRVKERGHLQAHLCVYEGNLASKY